MFYSMAAFLFIASQVLRPYSDALFEDSIVLSNIFKAESFAFAVDQSLGTVAEPYEPVFVIEK